MNIFIGEDQLHIREKRDINYSGHNLRVKKRPSGKESRLKGALLVLRGKADIVIWRYQ